MRGLLAAVLILGGVLLLGACTTEEEAEEEPTPTGTRTATTVATKTATSTPAGAAASSTPGRDFVRRPKLPSPGPTQTAAPVKTPAPQPTAVPPTAPPPTAAPTVVVTAAPTAPPPVQTPTPRTPSWQTSAPLEPVPAGTNVGLGIRNANGAPGETYPIGMSVQLPDQTSVVQEGTVSGDDWLTFYFWDTWQTGFYDVYFGLPQSDWIYAQTYFEVVSSSPSDVTALSWQVSAPRQAVAAGTVVEVGLRNEYGYPGECYDFVVEVYDPEGYVASGADTVCADEWTYLTYSDTWISGYYDVSYYVSGVFVASDYFQVGY